MLSTSELQLRLMPLDARRAAVERFALRGWTAEQISTATGLPLAEVHLHLGTSTGPSSTGYSSTMKAPWERHRLPLR